MADGTDGRLADLNLEEARILLEVALRVADGHSLDEQLAILVQLVTEATGADRGTLFVNDPRSNELYSRFSVGGLSREIRLLNHQGIAGHVFQSGEGLLVEDAYTDPRFNPAVDQQTGYRTRSIACAPVRTVQGDVIGAVQVLNRNGDGGDGFSSRDLKLLEAMAQQAAVSLQRSLLLEEAEREKEREAEFLALVSEISGEIQLPTLLAKIIGTISRMLQAERSTLFLNDERSNELYTEIGEGLGSTKIRFPNHLGIAGTVFTSGQPVNIPHAYADLRFNPSFDRSTGFFTRSILCTPVVNKAGKVIGVTQVLNKRGGSFDAEDEARLKAFTAQVAVALENAKLFDDVQTMKNYAESMLESMPSGVVTLNAEGVIQTCNAAGLRILDTSADRLLGRGDTEVFGSTNPWLVELLRRVNDSGEPSLIMDAELVLEKRTSSANLNGMPLTSAKGDVLGTLLMIDDISEEKRMKGTMARYMDPAIASELMASGAEVLGGAEGKATILFSDIRRFTTITEALGAHATVSLLNDYFTLMVDCLQREGGMLDKFIGDAIMAVFGLPLAHEDDEDRAMRTALAMLRSLEGFNRQRSEQGLAPIAIGIGLHTDSVVSGNIGSPRRMNYTVIGDGVNLASRLESACKQYGAQLLISESTRQRLRGTYRIREADRVVVKGKSEPVVIHEVLDHLEADRLPQPMDVLNHYRDGLAHYHQQRWERASAAFGEALRIHPGDQLSAIYRQRCAHFLADPPGDDWDGVWVLQEK